MHGYLIYSVERTFMKNIIDYIYEGAENEPERRVFNFLDCSEEPYQSREITIKMLKDNSQDIAWAMKESGAKKGDRAIILCTQDAGTVYAVLGCMMAGVIFTVIPPPIDDGKLLRFISVLKSCKPKFLISNYELEQGADSGIKKTIAKKAFLEAVSLKRIYTDQVKKHKEDVPFRTPDDDDIIYLQYTSGSTSEPKGVMVTSGNLMSCLNSSRDAYDYSSGNSLVSWVPFYHNIGLVSGIFLPITADQGEVYFVPPLQFLTDPKIWIKVLADFKANATAGPNSAYEACTRIFRKEEAEAYDLSHVNMLLNGSEFVHSETIGKFCDLFGLKTDSFTNGYGLSECVCVGTVALKNFKYQNIDMDAYQEGKFIPTENDKSKTIVSLGRPIGDIKMLAVREDGAPCSENEIGEIYMQGDSVCKGYWENPKESERFKATVQGHDGCFFRTEDMGAIYGGELYLTGRLKEMLIVNGKNIFPSDIALLLRKRCPAISEEAISVFSVLTSSGEDPVLCIESEPRLFEPIVRDINRAMVQSFEFSFSDIVFVKTDTLPRTDNRKIKTNATRQYYEQGRLDALYSTKASGKPDLYKQHYAEELPKDASIDTIREFIRNVFKNHTEYLDFDDNTDFTDLGVDSLTAVEMLDELEHLSGVEIDIRYISDLLTVNGLSLHIQKLLAGEAVNRVDWAKETVLPETIRPEGEYSLQPWDCRKILLTGSTGFLGAYLIRALLKGSHGKDITIYCHARAENEEKAMERIVANMKFFKCWDERFRGRLVAVPGDLTKTNLGMEKELYDSLKREIDSVYHNGAVLNFLSSYNRLKPTNVGGTVEALRFASAGKPKYFHYVSSYSVFDNPSHFGKTVTETDPLTSPDGYFLGYSETKWVSEKLVAEAANRGLRTAVYRPGEIVGGRKEGVWKLEDMISRTLVGCIQMRAVPKMDISLPLTPVDFVSSAIASISCQSEAIGKKFNIINKHLISTGEIGGFIKKAGFRFSILPYETWCDRLVKIPPSENVLSILSRLFTDKRGEGESLLERYGIKQAVLDTSGTDALLAGSGVVCRRLDKKYFLKYLKMFMKAGFISKGRS